MSDTQPTSSNGDASPSDPIDRIERFLAAQDGDSTGQTTDDEPQGDDEGDEPKNAAKPDDPKDGEPDEKQEPQLTTAQFAALLGVEESALDLDDDGQPVFRTKIDGKEGKAKFTDLVKSYQLGIHADNRAREAAEKEKAAERKVQEAEQAIAARYQQFQQNLQDVHNLTAVAHAELQREYNAIPWDQLRQADPAEFAAKQLEFQNRNARIQGVFQNIAQRNQQAAQAAQWQQQQQQAAAAQAEQAALAAEAGRVVELIPEWKDPAVAEKESKQIQAWALKEGYAADELNLRRAHQVKALRMAWQQATLSQARPEVENKVRAAPKLVKPSTAPQPDTTNSAILKDLKQKARTTGGDSTKAVAAWLQAKGLA